MNAKTKVIIIVLALATSFAAGRFLIPQKIVTQTKTVTVEVEKEKQDTNTHTETVDKILPDGTKTITTVTDTSTKTTTTESNSTKTDTKSETTYAKDGVTISALAGIDVTNPAKGFVYGASISKPILGPISFGAFGLTNGTVGVSLGLKF